MQIVDSLSDAAVLVELGARVRRIRLQRNITQAALAREAGISLPTLQRLEAGASVQLASLLRVLRALGQLANLDAALPAPTVEPMALLIQAGRERTRAHPGAKAATKPWTWEE